MSGKGKGNGLIILLIVLLLGGAAILGWKAYGIIADRRGGAQIHEEQLAYIHEATPVPTEEPTPTPEPIDLTLEPEDEGFDDIDPELMARIEAEAEEAFAMADDLPTPMPVQPAADTSSSQSDETASDLPVQPTEAVLPTEPDTETNEQHPAAIAAVPVETAAEQTASPDTPAAEQTGAPLETALPEITPVPETEESAASGKSVSDRPSVTVVPTLAPTQERTSTPTPAPIVIETAEPTAVPEPTPSPSPEPRVGRPVTSQVRYTVDFEQLAEINPDIRAWIVQEGTNLDYPVVQGKDNEYYLNHLFNRSVNKTGSIFLDSRQSKYFINGLIWIFGHNRKDDTMFATLPYYMQQSYYEAHPEYYLLTPYEDYLVQIFACVRLSMNNEEDWHFNGFKSKADFEEYVAFLRENSKIKSDTEVRWGDQLLTLVTCTNEVHEERYLVFGVMRPIDYVDAQIESISERLLNSEGTYSKTVDVPGRGEVRYYAQNDPTWYRMRYESRKSSKKRPLGTSGCCPTAMAMALSAVATDEQLMRLDTVTKDYNGYTFCPESVNQFFCNKKHTQFRARTVDDFHRYLPVILASFCSGNNIWDVNARSVEGQGTSAAAYKYIAHACSLDYTYSNDIKDALAAIDRGGAAVFSTGGKNSPYTGGGHYLTLIGYDDEYFYILDPFWKESYEKTDTHHVLEVIEPGYLRAKRSDRAKLLMYSFYIIAPRI